MTIKILTGVYLYNEMLYLLYILLLIPIKLFMFRSGFLKKKYLYVLLIIDNISFILILYVSFVTLWNLKISKIIEKITILLNND